MVVSVVSQAGEKLEERALHNVALCELFENEPVVIIDWLADGKRPTLEELETPVGEYVGWYGWGSAVKRGQTLGLKRDLLVECGLLQNAERSIMTGRMLVSQGIFGGLKGKFKVRVVKAGTVIKGHLVDDGFGLMDEAAAELGYNGHDKTHLGRGKQNYSLWQRIPWSAALQAELKRIIDATLIEAADPANWLYREGAAWEERKAIAALDDDMMEHPYITQALSRSSADAMARVATTVAIPTLVRVAVPTTVPKATVTGKHILVRYPVDSNGSIQATRTRPGQKEVERVAKMEVIQHTVGSRELMAKGCFGVVEGLDVDLVLCLDDIKMTTLSLKHGDVIELDGAVVFNQWFAAGSAIGINPKWAKNTMGLDFDGDLVFVHECADLPVLWQTARDLVPGETPKLVKTTSDVSERIQMILNSMRNLVGFASNVAAATFCTSDREGLAHQLGYADEAALNAALNWYIKVGTDGFKTMVDLNAVEKKLQTLQSNILRILGKGAPWCKWPNEWAFRRGVPDFYRKDMDENEKANCIPVSFDGTVAQLCRLTLPSLRAALGTPITVKPLSHYRIWAPNVNKVLSEDAHNLQLEFNARIKRVNFSDVESIQSFKTWWQDRLYAWVEDRKVTARAAAYALWREAHSSRSQNMTAASIFMGFPGYARAIIIEKPGLQKDTNTLLLGLQYVFDGDVPKLDVPVEVCEFEQVKDNKRLIRKIVCGEVEGKKAPRDPYPADLIGMVDMHAEQPECGTYMAHIVPAGHGKAWHCRLTAV
jgi:hypothetical protein